MPEWLSRTELLIRKEGIEKLKKSRVAIFGIGGVGGNTVEALIRAGLGEIDLIDNDVFSPSNLNRQLFATRKTLGKYKVEAARTRILDINPDAKVNIYKIFYTKETSKLIDFSKYDYVVDAIDTVKSKTEIIINAKNANVPVISAMGAGNKMNPLGFIVSDISKTTVCPLARAVRYELKKCGIKKVKVVYSKEPPIKSLTEYERQKRDEIETRFLKGSISFVPSAMGLIIACEVVKDLINSK